MEARGEVRRLADAFAGGEVEKASLRLRSAVDSHRHTLRTLDAFLHDNQQLIKLVQDLPSKVSHPIMVSFGKAAFFPGKLVHTNEFLVLLGEGYYAECSAIRTLEILGRRGNLLGTQIAGVKSQLADLDVESRFFEETLAEAAAGCVEIREEFVEPLSSGSALNLETGTLESPDYEGASSNLTIREKLGKGKEVDDDKEHELLMARLDEIEAAEAAAERDLSLVKNNLSFNGATADQEHGSSLTEFGCKTSNNEGKLDIFTVGDHAQGVVNTDNNGAEELAKIYRDVEERPSLQGPGDLLKFEEWRRCNSRQGDSNQVIEMKREGSMLPSTKQEVKEPVENIRSLNQVASGLQTEQQGSTNISVGNKAFTGSVVERSGPTPRTELSQDARQSQRRPASKFKMRQADK